MDNGARLIVFDLDGTLTHRSTFIPFLRHLCRQTARNFPLTIGRFAWPLAKMVLRLADPSAVKQHILVSVLKDVDSQRLSDICLSFAPVIDRMLIPDMKTRLDNYIAQNCHTIIVSASLGEWIEPWARKTGVDAVIATRLKYDGNGFPTGFNGANCKGEEKAGRLRDFISRMAPRPDEIIGFGNSRSDLPMLACCDKAYLVKFSFGSKKRELENIK